MLERLTSFALRRPRFIAVAAVFFFLIAAAVSAPVMMVLTAGGFEDPKAESSVAEQVLNERFEGGNPNLVLLVQAPDSIDDPDVAAAGTALTDKLANEEGITDVRSYWTAGKLELMRGEDGRTALIVGHVSGDEDTIMKTTARLSDQFTGKQGILEVSAGGRAAMDYQGAQRITLDLIKAEAVALPITLLLLLLAFRTIPAAVLPYAIAAVTVIGSLAVLVLINLFTEVSIFAINLSTALGLGLAIDYSMIMVSRYREELARGRPLPEALRVTMRTAGHTVAFSALTAMLSLAVLLIFPLSFLRSFAYAGLGAVFIGAVGAVLLLPAILVLLGSRIESFPISRKRGPGVSNSLAGGELWRRLALVVMKRPWPVLGVVLIVLFVLLSPFARVSFGLPDDRALPADLQASQVGTALRTEFTANAAQNVRIVLPDSKPDLAVLNAYAEQLSDIPGVVRVNTIAGTYAGGEQVSPPMLGSGIIFSDDRGEWISLDTDVEAHSDAGQAMIADIRSLELPGAPTILVSGEAARFVDTLDAIRDKMPIALVVIAMLTLVLLFMFTGSVVLPFKALAMNLLSLTATYGAMVWVFQEGHLRWLVGDFTVTGYIDLTMPILMFCIIFGVSMDYEVLLLSRIKEEYDRTGDNAAAVATGLAATGRLITMASVLLAIFLLALVSAGVTHVKMLGLGTALAIVMDAFVIRGFLAPAFMRVMGRANWWAPEFLRGAARFAIRTMPEDPDPKPRPEARRRSPTGTA